LSEKKYTNRICQKINTHNIVYLAQHPLCILPGALGLLTENVKHLLLVEQLCLQLDLRCEELFWLLQYVALAERVYLELLLDGSVPQEPLQLPHGARQPGALVFPEKIRFVVKKN
jgi:hypothetical protein